MLKVITIGMLFILFCMVCVMVGVMGFLAMGTTAGWMIVG